MPPRGRWSACMQVTPVIGDQEVTPRHLCGQPVERSTPVARLEEWTRRLPVVSTDDDQFRALLDRSTRDVAGLRIFDPEFPDRAVVAAGAPWFMTLFGRDSLITSWMTMLVDPDLALGHAADAGALPGHEGRPAHRGGARPDPPRDALRRDRVARARRRSHLLRHRRRDAAVRDARRRAVALGEPPRRGRRAAARRRPRARVDHRVRRQGRRRLRRVPAHHRPRLAEPGLEGLVGLDALRRRHARRDADRAVRGAGLRVRRARRPLALRDRGRRPRAGRRRCARAPTS